MAIKTNMTVLVPRRESYKRKIPLVSGGYSCRQAWPDGQIEIVPWDQRINDFVYESSNKLSPTRVANGLLEMCCKLNGAPVGKVVASEVATILLASRAAGLGGQIKYNANCPRCSHTMVEEICLPDDLEPLGKKAPDYPGYDDIKLPKCADVVRVRPLLVEDDMAIEERSREDKQRVSDSMMSLCRSIVSINDSIPDSIEELIHWYECLCAADVTFLDRERVALVPRLNNAVPHECDNCGAKFSVRLTFDMAFFL